jgi:branched-chain amino acid transport system substrate-binding protein
VRVTRRRWRHTLAIGALIGLVAASGCAGDDGSGSDGPVTVYVSLPLHGASAPDGRDAADGARLALADAHGAAGERKVRAVVLDDTEGAADRARWRPAQAAANARQATEDSTAIAYVGDFESGATRSSLPITNAARMLQVSPASSAVDLVSPLPGSDDVPDVQASGERTFGRVIPSDEAQGRAGGAWVHQLRWRNVEVLRDHTPFGDSLAEGFKAGAGAAGVNPRTSLGSGHVYYAGESLAGAKIARQAAAQGLQLEADDMASDLYLSPYDPRSEALRFYPLYVTSAALDPTQLPPAGEEFVQRFRDEYGRPPGRYAAYGYEAMAIVLDSVDRAGNEGTDREAVVDAFFDTTERDSVLGTYSIDEVGDTTLGRLTGYRLEQGRAGPIAELSVP